MKLSTDLQIAISVAMTEAAGRGHEFAGLEHMMVALLLDEKTSRVLRHAGADTDVLKEGLIGFLDDPPPLQMLHPSPGQLARLRPDRPVVADHRAARNGCRAAMAVRPQEGSHGRDSLARASSWLFQRRLVRR